MPDKPHPLQSWWPQLTTVVGLLVAGTLVYASLTTRVTALEKQSDRLARIERLVEELVCLDDRASRDLCRKALTGRRP